MTEHEKRAEWESEQEDLDNCCDVRGGQDRCGDCPKDRGLTRIAPTKVFPEPRQDSAVLGAPRPAPSDYTPTTRGVRQGYASGRNRRGEMQPVAAKKAFDRWLAQYTAEKRAEWERAAAEKALTDAADAVLVSDWWAEDVTNSSGNVCETLREWLRARAAAYLREETE